MHSESKAGLKAIKYISYFMGGLFAWTFTFIVVHLLAKVIVRLLAFNLTNSKAINIGCCKFEWDIKLQIAAYSLYAGVFLLIVRFLIAVRKHYGDSVLPNRILMVIFIMIFPTHTFWGVASICGGFGGCSNGYYFNIIVPTIMSINPLAIIVSAFVAYHLAKLYARKYA